MTIRVSQLLSLSKSFTKVFSSSVEISSLRRMATVGSERKPFMIGVAGGTASGKSTVCDKLMEKLGQNQMNIGEKQVVHLSQDSFYRELSQVESEKARKGMFNFDHPNAFDNELMETCLQSILDGRQTQIPVYDFKTNARVPGAYTVIYPSDVVLVEVMNTYLTIHIFILTLQPLPGHLSFLLPGHQEFVQSQTVCRHGRGHQTGQVRIETSLGFCDDKLVCTYLLRSGFRELT